ncbi:class I SAM-dependent methyltransferase [Galbibacter sp. PAP.153]|uniref:class I SAM-dependent methyltransferase n=1 Tax=Galbibacter sp. PAP.153 TaxID=3104623 RepID=UPI0030091245
MKADIFEGNVEDEFQNILIKPANIETIQLDYKEAVKLITDSLSLYPKLRLLDLYFGQNPLLPFLFKGSPISYFGFETSNELIQKSKTTYQYYIRQRKAVFSEFDGLHVPYVMNFFHRVLSIDPKIAPFHIEAYLQEIFRVMAPGGIMVFTYKTQNYEECLGLIQRVQRSSFRIDDLKVLNMDLNRETDTGYRTVFFILEKPEIKKKSVDPNHN